jgi:positive regulator of sigma E activity
MHDTSGSLRDHEHMPMMVTCSTHYCLFTVTSAVAFTLFLTDAKGFWLTLYIYTQIHTHTHTNVCILREAGQHGNDVEISCLL